MSHFLPVLIEFVLVIFQILSDFSIESVIKVVNFMHTGKTFINSGDKAVQNEIRSLIEILEVGVDLSTPETNNTDFAVGLDSPDLERTRTPAEPTISRATKSPHPATQGTWQILSSVTTPTSSKTKTAATTAANPRHVQHHFPEPKGKTRLEERPQPIMRVKTEPEDPSYSSPQILSVQSLQSTVDGSTGSGSFSQNSFSSEQASPMVPNTQGSLVASPSCSVEMKPRLKVKPNLSVPSEAHESPDEEESNVDYKDKVKCLMCKLSISNIQTQVERHLAISHFAQELSDEFGHSKVDCPRCGKFLKTRRGFLTHVFSQHTNLPKTFAAVKKAMDNQEINVNGVRGKSGRKTKYWKLEARHFSSGNNANQLACPYCSQTTTNKLAMVSHVCHAHFNKVSHLLMPSTIEKSTCGICKQQFGTFGALTYHLATTHHLLDKVLKGSGKKRKAGKIQTRRRKNKLTYYCPECPVEIDSYFAVIVHLGHIHFKDVVLSHSKPDHTCKLCDRSFSNLGPLAYHLVAAHEVLKSHIPPKDQLIKPRSLQERKE